jgi:hypothetical protein
MESNNSNMIHYRNVYRKRKQGKPFPTSFSLFSAGKNILNPSDARCARRCILDAKRTKTHNKGTTSAQCGCFNDKYIETLKGTKLFPLFSFSG